MVNWDHSSWGTSERRKLKGAHDWPHNSMIVDFVLCGVMLGQLALWAHCYEKERRFLRVIVVRTTGRRYLERVKLTGKIWATAVSMALTGFSMWYTYCTFVESFGV